MRTWQRLLVAASLGACPALVLGQTVRNLIDAGNQAYAAGRYADALQQYEAAVAASAEWTAELLHNQAAALFHLGRLEDARALWSEALTLKDAAFEARTHYNLGNCDYAEALRADDPTAGQQVLEKLSTAAEHYRTALQMDPTLHDARANLELAQLLKRQLEQQMQNQPQNQSCDGDPQDQPDQQPSSQPSDPQQQQDASPSQQPSEGQPQQDQPPESEQNQPSPETEQPPETQPAQPPPQPETQPAESQPASAQSEPQDVRMSREEAERLMQMIRDAEKARREALARQRAARYDPAERDW